MPATLKPEAVRFLVVHCSATPAKVFVDRAVIDRWHRERGWLGIGYHYVIKRDGLVEYGRGITEVGAHVEGRNHESIGICMAGGMDAANKNPEDNFTPEQFIALKGLLKGLLTDFPKAEIVGHRDLNPGKACPSFDAKAWWHMTMNGEGA